MTFVPGERMDLTLTSAPAMTTRHMAHSAGQALARTHQVKFPRAGILDEQLQVRNDLGPEFRWHTFVMRQAKAWARSPRSSTANASGSSPTASFPPT